MAISPLLFITTSLVALLAIVLASQQSYRYSVVPLPSSAVVISGASTGLGRDLALTLCSKSAGAVFAGVRTADAGADLVQAARSRGCAEGSLRPLRLDVTRDDSVAEAAATVRAALAETGLKLAGIVNNAGISYRESARGLDVSEAMYVYNVNVFGVLRLTTAFLPLLERNGGRIVNTGSVAGLVGLPRWVPYSDTKHALESISDSWRRELQGEGISVSVLEPGFVRSELCTRPVCKGDPAETTTPAFLHALTAERPRARYAVAKTGLMPAWFVAWLLRALPDRILDAVLTQLKFD
jgi:NAD(P)-dependent dehydrogenase (short-subunit alcohol dehydrogenase family)